MAIKQSKTTLQSAEDFFVWAKNSCNNSTVSYIYISQNDYDTCDRDVRAMCDNTLVVTVPGTMKAQLPYLLERVMFHLEICLVIVLNA